MRNEQLIDVQILQTSNDNKLIKLTDSCIAYADRFDCIFNLSNIKDLERFKRIKAKDYPISDSKLLKSTYDRMCYLVEFYQSIGCNKFYHNIYNLENERGNITFNRVVFKSDNSNNIIIKYGVSIHSIINILKIVAIDNHPNFNLFVQNLDMLGINVFDVDDAVNLTEYELMVLIHQIIDNFTLNYLYRIADFTVRDERYLAKEFITKYITVGALTRKYITPKHIEVKVFDSNFGSKNQLLNGYVIAYICGVRKQFKVHFNSTTLMFELTNNQISSPVGVSELSKRNKRKRNHLTTVLDYLNGEKFLTSYRILYLNSNK